MKGWLVTAYKHPADKLDGLVDSAMLAVGIKIMATLNIKTDVDIANGARGRSWVCAESGWVQFNPKVVLVTLQLQIYVLIKLV
ncbi:hypothetical protein FRC08_017050 [Ceratobasidium sp. 394]|nr:hypothetical protein FRC08_017050 [Ceratobasidium sp. 394]